MKRSLGVFAASLLLLPGAGFGASREQQEMQRDIAQLQDQVRALQSTLDQKLSSLQTLMEQSLDAGNKANTNVSVLSSSVTATLDRELKESLRPLAGATARMDNIANDVAEVKSSVTELNSQMNRLMQQLTDINNAVKVMQAPAAPPPPASTNGDASTATPGGPGAMPRAGTAPPAKALFENAMTDYSSGKSDLAATEFADFIRYYPDDPNAPAAQFFIGQVHSSQQKYDQAAADFDVVLERFSENKYTPDAYFMKGMSLKLAGHRDAAAIEFRLLVKKYPRSDRAVQASEQLRALGLSPTAAGPPATAKRRK